MISTHAGSLGSQLDHEPTPLRFGTSGRRGRLTHLTQVEVYATALAELDYLQSLPVADGGIKRGEAFYFAADLRPSSQQYVAAAEGRGELAQAIERAIRDAGMEPVNLGCIPTPALSYYALQRNKGSMMITGSHIPFDYNGFKTNRATGELRKQDEQPIGRLLEKVRQRLYSQPANQSLFDSRGQFRSGHAELSVEVPTAREEYLQRYTNFFAGKSLKGLRLLVYQHSAVSRDLLVELLQRFGAEVIPAGRSDSFVAIDTENVDAQQVAEIQSLANKAWVTYGPLDAVISTDGDGDRPLLLGFEGRPDSPGRVQFFSGDLVGMIVAEYLEADAVVVPITCNDAIDRGALRRIVAPKTRIGSPFVLAGIESALARGRRRVCGWEPNGGFVLGSDFVRGGHVLRALPTRDAMLPILGVLFCAVDRGLSVAGLFGQLPKRFNRAALLKNFPREVGRKIVQRFSPASGVVRQIQLERDRLCLLEATGKELPTAEPQLSEAKDICKRLSQFFGPAHRFAQLTRVDYTDGVRLYFENEDIAHFRPSGNADELRMYAVADSQARANEIVEAGVAEPDGILRRMEASARNSA